MTRAPLLALLALAACGPEPVRLSVPPAEPGGRVPFAFASVEVLDVSLPTYAEGEEIFVRDEGGALAPLPGALWADDPGRAVTLDLARALGALTGARASPEPFPFAEGPDAQVDVRVAEFAADLGADGGDAADNAFVIRGVFFVAAQEGGGDRAREFRVSAPLPADPGPAAIAVARGEATAALAREIAGS